MLDRVRACIVQSFELVAIVAGVAGVVMADGVGVVVEGGSALETERRGPGRAAGRAGGAALAA